MAQYPKEPEYVTQCTLPVNLIHPEKRGTEGYRVPAICGRQLTMCHIVRNECPACRRPLRQYASLAEELAEKRKIKNNLRV